MTRFEPFRALRYNTSTGTGPANLSAVIAPPYDVLSDADRTALELRDQHNSVRLDYPHGKTDPGAYAAARATLDDWRARNVLTWDAEPTLTVYRMTDPLSQRVTTGVIGALGLEHPGVGDVLPHEETTSKDKADRLSLIRETQINTSPIWVLATTTGLGKACAAVARSRPADAEATDTDNVRHEVWIVKDPSTIDSLCAFVRDAPVVVADGHHRLETALTYETERPTANAIMTFVVELSPDELDVRPIHRIIDLDSEADLPAVLAALDVRFTRSTIASDTNTHPDGLVLLKPGNQRELLVPKPGAFAPNINLDSQRIREALQDAPNITTRFHHDIDTVAAATEAGPAFGVLLRPATVAQIRAVADERTRMPPKTTFFFPKPRTGIVLRPVE